VTPRSGWLAKTGRLALGYLGDADKTARTYPVVDGVRYAIPGDRARLLEGGIVELHGRDSVTINSGGEKIFAEEVEAAIKSHPYVYDCVVAGRPSERWGNEVVADRAHPRGTRRRRRRAAGSRRRAHRALQAAQGSIFVTFLPPEPGLAFQLTALSCCVLVEWLWFGTVALAFTHRAVRARYAAAKHVIDRVTGTVLAGLGARLVLAP
jgi:hypothetical protein